MENHLRAMETGAQNTAPWCTALSKLRRTGKIAGAGRRPSDHLPPFPSQATKRTLCPESRFQDAHSEGVQPNTKRKGMQTQRHQEGTGQTAAYHQILLPLVQSRLCTTTPYHHTEAHKYHFRHFSGLHRLELLHGVKFKLSKFVLL